MLFLAVFGKNVEDSFGHMRYLALYIVGGFVAAMTQTAMTLLGGSGGRRRRAEPRRQWRDRRRPRRLLRAVSEHAGPGPRGRVPGASPGLGVPRACGSSTSCFEANFGLFSAHANGGGTAFFAHVGGFVFGVIVARILVATRHASAGAGDLAQAGAIP